MKEHNDDAPPRPQQTTAQNKPSPATRKRGQKKSPSKKAQSMKTAGEEQRVPASLVPVRRLAQSEVNHYQDLIEALYEQFDLKNFTTESVNFPALATLLEKIIQFWNADAKELRTFSEFQKWHRQRGLESLLSTDPELPTLTKHLQLVEDMLGLTRRMTRRLSVALQGNLMRYCVSLRELCLTDIPFIVQYEKSIRKNRPDILTELRDLQHTLHVMRTFAPDLLAAVHNAGDILECVRRVRASLNKLYYLAMEWADEDAAYLENAEEEAAKTKEERDSLRENISKLQGEEAQLSLAVSQMKAESSKEKKRAVRLRQQVKVNDESMANMQERLSTIDEQIIAVDAKLAQLEKNIKRGEMRRKQQQTPRDSTLKTSRDVVQLEHERQDQELIRRRLSDRRLSTLKHIARLRRQREKLAKDLQQRETRIANIRSELPVKKATLTENRDALKQVRPKYESAVMKMEDLKVVRDKKSSSSHLRELHNFGHVLPVRSEPSSLDRACEFVSERVSANWRQLYPHLPMRPARDSLQREQDMQRIDSLGARHDLIGPEQARMALNKWRLFFHRCQLEDLLEGLRAAQLQTVATEVEEQFLGSHTTTSSSSPEPKKERQQQQEQQEDSVGKPTDEKPNTSSTS